MKPVEPTDGQGIASSGAPRVEACIESVMARHPTIGGRADSRYFEAVHQELAPLARELERKCAALHDQYSDLALAVEWMLADGGNMTQEHLARIRAAWEAVSP